MAFSLDYITKQYIDYEGDFSFERAPSFYPSEASYEFDNGDIIGKCHRATYYRLTKQKPTNPPSFSSRLKMKLGKVIEEAVIESWKKAGIWRGNNTKFYDAQSNISGELDCVICDPNNPNEYWVVEVKTFDGYQAAKSLLGLSGEEPKPKDENLMQGFIYAVRGRDKFKGTKIYYLARDKGDTMEFDITVLEKDGDFFPIVTAYPPGKPPITKTYTNLSYNNLIARYAKLAKYLVDGEVPPREYSLYYTNKQMEEKIKEKALSDTDIENYQSGINPKTRQKASSVLFKRNGDWQCSYCNYKDKCWQTLITNDPEAVKDIVFEKDDLRKL